MQIELAGSWIRQADHLPEALHFMQQALWHQTEVYRAAQAADIILDLAPTGTGKTQAGLLTLLHQPAKHAVYIAPTNALIQQQAEAARRFLAKAGLPHLVVEANAAAIRDWPGTQRPGEKLRNLLRNPGHFFPEAYGRPVLLITNPDIFYYATSFAYHRLDNINVAQAFITSFQTVIFDEFHLYDAKQITGLIFYMILSKVLGFFDHGRKLILLTATPEPACEALLARLEDTGIRIVRIEGETQLEPLLPSQTPVHLELCLQPEYDTFLEILVQQVTHFYQTQPQAYGAVILDSLDLINRLSDRLKALNIPCGRITGPIGQAERQMALSKPVLLATQTVDVGFNFSRNPEPERQNLDWILFSARDHSSFWQRLGRVGRVLGKVLTQTASKAIAYVPEPVWEQLQQLPNPPQDRASLKTILTSIDTFNRPFQSIYWRSDALLEVARPLCRLEKMLKDLPQAHLIEDLFNSVRQVMAEGRGQSWKFYRYRQSILMAAEQIARDPRQCMSYAGTQVLSDYLKTEDPETWAHMEAGAATSKDYAQALAGPDEQVEVSEMRTGLQTFAQRLCAAYQPLQRFRQSLFSQFELIDPQALVSDLAESIALDPLHLLRHYEFRQQENQLVLTGRAKPSYQITLLYQHPGTRESFEDRFLNRPTALQGVKVQRHTQAGAIVPTPLLASLSQGWLPGMIICPQSNGTARWRLQRKGLRPFDIQVDFLADFAQRDYIFYPHLEGWLALAQEGVRLRLPENNEPWII